MEATIRSPENQPREETARLHYLDWLRAIAILMVFLFHAVHPFDFFTWEIKNRNQSEIITIILVLLDLWGMQFFFMIAGTASWFALRHRSSRQYITERVNRLLIPYIVGTILFSPLQYYLSWVNKVQLGVVTASFWDFLRDELPRLNSQSLIFPGFSPRWIAIGFHLWFVGFLFCFALITLPFFQWWKSGKGKPFASRLAGICERRGGILIFILPLLLIQFCLQPFAMPEHDWQDFIYLMAFFTLGFILYADERITQAVRRDGWLCIGVGTVLVIGLILAYALGLPLMVWGQDPSLPQFYLLLSLTTPIALCYSVGLLFIGMRWLDFRNKLLDYLQEAIMPFFIFHQPVIVGIAFFIVQWNAGIWIKLPMVVLSSFVVTIGIYELIVRRIRPLRLVFGMKVKGPEKQQNRPGG
jgi:glucan biosynthesis protein C